MVQTRFHFPKCWYHLGFYRNLHSTRNHFREPTHLQFVHCQQSRIGDCQSMSFRTNGSHQRNCDQYLEGSWKTEDSYKCTNYQWQIMEASIDSRWAVQNISCIKLCRMISESSNGLIIANQVKRRSLNSDHNSSPGTRAPELTLPRRIRFRVLHPDRSVQWKPS